MMRKEVEEVIRKHEQESGQRELEKRERVARHFNLMDEQREYFTDGDPARAFEMGFAKREITEDGTTRFYKVSSTPFKLTDDEYAALLELWDPDTETRDAEWETAISPGAYSAGRASILASVLMVVAAVIGVVGIFLAFVMGDSMAMYPVKFNFAAFFMIIGATLVTGLLFAALSQLVQHVYSIDCMMMSGAKAVTASKAKDQIGKNG